jgi:predicted DNA binding CopG/RHH family protein
MKKPIAVKREPGSPQVSGEPEMTVTLDALGRVVDVRYTSENGTVEETTPLPDKNGRRSAIHLGYSGKLNKVKGPAHRLRLPDVPRLPNEELQAITRWGEDATPDAAASKLKGFGKPKDLVGLPQDAASVVTRSVRMSSDLLDGIRDAAHAEGVSQEEWMRRQYMKGIGVKEPPAPPSGRSSSSSPRFAGLSVSERSSKKQIALRLEPELLDAFERAAKESGFPKNDWLRAAIVKALDEGLDVRAVLEPPSSN